LGKSGDSGRRQGDKGKNRTEGKSSTTAKSRWGLMFESRSETKKRTTERSGGSGSRLGMRDVAQALPYVAEERPTDSGESPYYMHEDSHGLYDSYNYYNLDSEDDDDDYQSRNPGTQYFNDVATPDTINISEKMVESEERWKEDGRPGGFEALNGLYYMIAETNGVYTWNPANQSEAAKEGAMLVKYEHDRRKNIPT
jgi:hypothetical protein